ncbi:MULTISPECIES: metal-sulfur cluster assembly factor [Actinotignum]|uniref:Metal-sulfur cluster assembly factor n=1 Tax=Actinotignum timonense TaxID=1870995 RepID=A0AAW9HKE7_9ACTO|nr:metal-sulfur cluster assembly factor [Actinotignum timonense]MDY5137835.1 metal-sulfur cluster assembly factor [Actinotignum timonense]MDY5139927.1 metal-sulfur cluster assembly factor [Actinotignum timonense]MDY5141628.1 metal-sulfur cluster assembly factor [Actinotignum timonense]MDY5149200.1 metal-sulfur cluster assembly factor [Actinotignum timonense]PLB84714.1 metal-sulfur cluster assembly factor [Actinotignum timonense]
MTEKNEVTPPAPEATAPEATPPAAETTATASAPEAPAPTAETTATASAPEAPAPTADERIGEVVYTDGDSPIDDVDPYLVLEAMKDVIDPELGVNIVDLGLVYGVTTNGRHLHLDMTLTSPACPLTDAITDGIIIATEDLVDDVDINWVWLPPWGPERITEDGRDDLRALGFNI